MTEQEPSISDSGPDGAQVDATALTSPTTPSPARTRPRWLWIALAAGAAVVLVAGGVAVGLSAAGNRGTATAAKPTPAASNWTPMHWDSSFTATGTLVLGDSGGVQSLPGGSCEGKGGYDDIHEGAQVVVTDQSGTVIATGALESGLFVGGHCMFAFTVPSVPTGKSFYGVSVSHRGTLQYKQEELQGGLQLSLGS